MSFKTEAFVLRARPWQKADRLYDLFTVHEGVISAVLRSAAKPGNKLAGHLLPFSKVRVMIGRGRQDHLAGVATINDFSNLRSSLHNLSLASAIAELLLKDQSRGYKVKEFMLLEEVLTLLDNLDISTAKKLLLVRTWLWKYLSLAGWQPQLDTCLICSQSIGAGKYVSGRGIICKGHDNSGTEVSAELITWLKFIGQADWHELVNQDINKNLNKEWLKISSLFYQSVYDRPSQALKLLAYG